MRSFLYAIAVGLLARRASDPAPIRLPKYSWGVAAYVVLVAV